MRSSVLTRSRRTGDPGPAAAAVPWSGASCAWAVIAAACSVGAVGLGLSSVADPQTALNLGNLLLLVTCLMAVAACLAAARRRGPDARAWLLLGVSAAVWAVAPLIWTVHGLLGHLDDPFPAAADLARLGYAIPATVGLLSFRRRVWPAGRRELLDGLVIATSLLFVSWSVVSGRITGDGGPDRLLALASPLVDTAVAALVLASVLRRAPGDRLPWLLVSGGLLILTGTGTVYMPLAGTTGPTGPLLVTGWVAAFVLVSLAAVASSRPLPGETVRGVHLLRELLPYGPVAGVLVTAADSQVFDDPLLTGLGAVVLVLVVARQVVVTTDNVGVRRQLENRVASRTAELMAARGDLQQAFDTSPIGMAWADPDGVFIEVNPAFCDMLGRSRVELVGTAVTAVTLHADVAASRRIFSGAAGSGGVHPYDRVEMRYRHADGSEVWAQGTVSTIPDATGAPRAFVAQMQDVTARRVTEAALVRQAMHDPLTQLANRALLIDRLDQALARQTRQPDPLALLLLDLDGFKLVNDGLGHEAGDDVLRALASRLSARLRRCDTIARLGGDEFAVVLENTSQAQARVIAEQILAVVRVPVRTHGHSINPDASVGIATSTSDGDTPQTLLRNADLAMYAAKDSGKGRITVFTPSMHETTMRHLVLDSELREAVDGDQFVLAYQPIVSLATGRLEGFEALMRWQHPVRGVVLPQVFIPVAETAGHIVAMGGWALREACRQAAGWGRQHPGADELTMSVNLSVRQLHDPRLVDTVVAALADAGLPAARLQLEITEGALDHRQSTTILDRLHATGVRLALDDFGTGYSSLSRLHTLPIDRVKIDKSFVDTLASGRHAPVVAATIAMAHSLGLQTVAEGVETVEQLPFLHLYHCDDVQGYLFGRAISAAATDTLLRRRGTGTSWTDPARPHDPPSDPDDAARVAMSG